MPGSDLDNVVSQIAASSDPQAGLNQLHPALYNAFSLAQEYAGLVVRKAISNRLWMFEQDPCLCYPDCCSAYTFWAAPLGEWNHQGTIESPSGFVQLGFRSWAAGGVVGFDKMWNDNICFGGALAYTYDHVKWKGQSQTHGSINSGYGSLYTSYWNDTFFFQGTAVGAYNHYDGQRHILIDGATETIDRTAFCDENGESFDANIQIGYVVEKNSCSRSYSFSPFIGADWIYVHKNRFVETGAGSLNLNVLPNDANFVRGEAGINWAVCSCCGVSPFTFELGLSYVREERFSGAKDTATFVDLAPEFTVFGLNQSRNLLVPSLGFTKYYLNNQFSISVNYDAELEIKSNGLAKQYWNQNGMIRFAYSF